MELPKTKNTVTKSRQVFSLHLIGLEGSYSCVDQSQREIK